MIVKMMAEGLVDRGLRVTILGYDPTVSIDTVEIEAGVTVIRLFDRYEKKKPFRIGRYYLSLNQFWKRWFLSKKLESVIREYTVDLVESYDWSGPLWKRPSVPLVVRMHGANAAYAFYEGIHGSKVLRFFEKRNLKIADSLCAVSSHIGEITCQAFGLDSNFAVLHNSTDTTRFKELPEVTRDWNRILYVGRIVKRKGLVELFKTVNELFALDPKLYLDLAGSLNDQFHTELLQLIDASKRSRINFMGFVPNNNLPMLYSRTGLFVMPSRAEAFGITAIEAMSTSTAVAVTDKASGPEIVEHGVDGYVIDFTNSLDAARSLIAILQDKQALQAVGIAARQKVLDKFSLEKSLNSNLDFYTSVLENGL